MMGRFVRIPRKERGEQKNRRGDKKSDHKRFLVGPLEKGKEHQKGGGGERGEKREIGRSILYGNGRSRGLRESSKKVRGGRRTT